MSDPDLWKNREIADAKIKELGELNELVKKFDGIERLLEEAEKLFKKPADPSDGTGRPSAPAADGGLDSRPDDSDKVGDQARRGSETFRTTDQLVKEIIQKIQFELRQLEIEQKFKGKYDKLSAVISIFAGAGGQDAEDWAGMLYEMYSKYAQKNNWKTAIIDENYGDYQSKTGRKLLKDITFEVRGNYAYAYLKNESGVHRLVRISPFSPDKKRHTSFALVEILPDLERTRPFGDAQGEGNLKIPSEDLRVEFFRSSGPGGQNVNKVETAVRIIHIPTGIAAASQKERSQARNRERATHVLKGKLIKLMEETRIQEIGQLKTKTKPQWGNQIRSYVLQPYQLVKDHRTDVETSKVDDVLNGNIGIFVESSNFVRENEPKT